MHTCPRRAENGMDLADGPFRNAGQNLDSYEPGHGLIGQPRGCTYCGSMDPDDFMQAVRDGAEIGPTDKSYKVYVKGLPCPEPDALRIISSSSHRSSGLTAYADLTRAEKKAVKAEAKKRRLFPENFREGYFQLMPWGPTVEGKFYTAHLSAEQGDEFRALYAEGKIVIGYPGHFYRSLYIPSTRGADR